MKYLIDIPEENQKEVLWTLEKLVGKLNITHLQNTVINTSESECKTLPDSFTVEEMLLKEYRTDLYRKLYRVVMELGTQENELKVYHLYDLSMESDSFPGTDTDSYDLAINTSGKTLKLNSYDSAYPNQIFLIHKWYFSKYDSNHTHWEPIPTRITKKIKHERPNLNNETIKNIHTLLLELTSPDSNTRTVITEPKVYDPSEDFIKRLTPVSEAYNEGLISRRTYNCLHLTVEILEDIAVMGRKEVAKLRNLGPMCLSEIDEMMRHYGIPY